MLQDLINSIELEQEYMRRVLKAIEREIKSLDGIPEKAIIANRNSRGKLQYYFLESANGEKKRIYIRKENETLRRALQEKYYLKIAKEICSNNIEILNAVKNQYKTINPGEVVKNAPLAYREQENANRLIYGVESINRWKERKINQKNKYKTFMPESLKHVASDGTKTRSKSEAIICDMLNEKGIPYIYECPMKIMDRVLLPDFIILDTRNGREIIIEHLGLIGNEAYRTKQYKKIDLYIEAGYVPNENLLLTFEDKEGNINVPSISRMVAAILG